MKYIKLAEDCLIRVPSPRSGFKKTGTTEFFFNNVKVFGNYRVRHFHGCNFLFPLHGFEM